MPVTLRDARDSPGDRAWIRAAYRDYLAELSSSKSGLFLASAEWPDRQEELLAGWFADPGSHPFVILQDGGRAGFAVVARPPAFPRRPVDFRMSDFFVTGPARRRGVGAGAAALLFARFTGRWEVVEDEYNRGALAFWRRVIGRHCGGRYVELREAGEVCHRFSTTRHPEVPPA